AGDGAGLFPGVSDTGSAAADHNLLWAEPAESLNRAVSGHGDRVAAGQLERADRAAGILWNCENVYRVSGVVDWRAAGYGTSGSTVCADYGILRDAPGDLGAGEAIV